MIWNFNCCATTLVVSLYIFHFIPECRQGSMRFFKSTFLIVIAALVQSSLVAGIIDDYKCDQQLQSFNEALAVHELWALKCNYNDLWAVIDWSDFSSKVYDSWGKISSGYFAGNTHNLGSFGLCTKFRHELSNNANILGNYCLVTVNAIQNSTLMDEEGADEFDLRQMWVFRSDCTIGNDVLFKSSGSIVRSQNLDLFSAVCLPVTCSPEKVVQFANQHFFVKTDLVGVSAECKTADRRKLAAADYLFM